jgi:hypothetical protein
MKSDLIAVLQSGHQILFIGEIPRLQSSSNIGALFPSCISQRDLGNTLAYCFSAVCSGPLAKESLIARRAGIDGAASAYSPELQNIHLLPLPVSSA